MIKVGDTFYRGVIRETLTPNGVDINGEYTSYLVLVDSTRVEFLTYSVVKITLRGCWISDSIGHQRWIHNYSNKKYAYPTKKEALHSFIYRTKCRIRILKNQLATCERVLPIAQKLLDED